MSRERYEMRGLKGVGEGELAEARREVEGWLGGPRSAAAVERLIRAVIDDARAERTSQAIAENMAAMDVELRRVGHPAAGWWARFVEQEAKKARKPRKRSKRG